MTTMKRAAITGAKTTMLLDTPIPRPKEDWVLVKILAVPLCTEYKNWLNGSEYHGHEAAGEVVEVSRYARITVWQMRTLYQRRIHSLPKQPQPRRGFGATTWR